MSRLKLTLPEKFFFSTRMQIRITDLNYGGHVGNDRFLALIQEARQQFLNQLGYGELEIEEVGLIMTDASIEFKAELNYGDEVEIFVAATDFTRVGFDLNYRIHIIRTPENILAAKAKTGMLCYDYSSKKVVSIPVAALQKLSATIMD